jgi:hypothetical protein
MRIRSALTTDLVGMRQIMAAAIDQLQDGYLTPEQIKASHSIMGLTTKLTSSSKQMECFWAAAAGADAPPCMAVITAPSCESHDCWTRRTRRLVCERCTHTLHTRDEA